MCELYFKKERLHWQAKEGQTILEAARTVGRTPDEIVRVAKAVFITCSWAPH